MRLFYFCFAVLLSVALGLLSVFNALYLDWSLLEIGVICIMPVSYTHLTLPTSDLV